MITLLKCLAIVLWGFGRPLLAFALALYGTAAAAYAIGLPRGILLPLSFVCLVCVFVPILVWEDPISRWMSDNRWCPE